MCHTHRLAYQRDVLKQRTRHTVRLRSALSPDGKRVLRKCVTVDRESVLAAKRAPFVQGLGMAPLLPSAIYDLFGPLVPIVAATLGKGSHCVFRKPCFHYSRILGGMQSSEVVREKMLTNFYGIRIG
jgi:hypothetical protein